MITINSYVKPESLEEAYELNQKRANRILGGMMWMRLGSGRVQTAIDLSGMGLDQIEESEEEFKIGCMCTLRQLELHKGINQYTDGAVRECVRHIVGVQFRNQATVGGSIFGRFGFSDVLTMFLAMDSYVELYKGGIVSMEEFAASKRDRDILVRIIVKKQPMKTVYLSQRNSKTDFPVLTCALSLDGKGQVKTVVGACPSRARIIEDKEGMVKDFLNLSKEEQEAAAEAFGTYVQGQVKTGSNMRASREYRSLLVKVLTKRALLAAASKESQAGGME